MMNGYGLCDPIEDLGLGEVFAFLFCLFDLVMHVPHLAINHHNTQITIFIREGVLVRYNIDVT